MTTNERQKRVPLGATGERVAANIKRLRGSLQYKELSEKLGKIGRPIPALGLRRIEAGERRVDVDDLVALAVALGVSPLTLLLPADGNSALASPITGVNRNVGHNVQWMWARGDEPLTVPDGREEAERSRLEFSITAKPTIDSRVRGVAVAEFLDPDASEIEQDRALMAAFAKRMKEQGYIVESDRVQDLLDGDN